MTQSTAMPDELLQWQVDLRARTMEADAGKPHVGVAPLLGVTSPGSPGWTQHSIICGLLPLTTLLEEKTSDFKALYERHSPAGARQLYDRGLEYLKDYYREAGDFDNASVTTLLPNDSPVVKALRADAHCSLLFYVFQLGQGPVLDRMRCTQYDAIAELHESGAVYDNVWWHNTLFHGPAENHTVIRFLHQKSSDTTFGQLTQLA